MSGKNTMYMYYITNNTTCICIYIVHVYMYMHIHVYTYVPRKLKIHRMRANLQIGKHSADCAIIIVQTVEPQIPPYC